MSVVASAEELLRCFREIDRGHVELPPGLSFPLDVPALFSWALGPRAYLVFRERPTAAARGIVFQRNGGTSPDVAAMCEWCHAVRAHGGVKLLTAEADPRRRVGLYLCADLACSESARTLERIVTFASRRLF
jgi:hypothetical protein